MELLATYVLLPRALRFFVWLSFTEKDEVPGMDSLGTAAGAAVVVAAPLLLAAFVFPRRPWLPLEIFLCIGCEAGVGADCVGLLLVYSKSISLSLSSA